MSRNALYMAIGALAVIVVVLAVYAYQQATKPKGIELEIDDSGISIQQN